MRWLLFVRWPLKLHAMLIRQLHALRVWCRPSSIVTNQWLRAYFASSEVCLVLRWWTARRRNNAIPRHFIKLLALFAARSLSLLFIKFAGYSFTLGITHLRVITVGKLYALRLEVLKAENLLLGLCRIRFLIYQIGISLFVGDSLLNRRPRSMLGLRTLSRWAEGRGLRTLYRQYDILIILAGNYPLVSFLLFRLSMTLRLPGTGHHSLLGEINFLFKSRVAIFIFLASSPHCVLHYNCWIRAGSFASASDTSFSSFLRH